MSNEKSPSQNRLIQGMFGGEFRPRSDTVCFSYLQSGQMRGHDFCHNAGWYNKLGEKIGWGDLDLHDFKKIRAELLPTEVFFILSESASFWNHVTYNPGIIGAMCSTSPKMLEPNLVYALEHAMYLITNGNIYMVSRYAGENDKKTYKPDYRVPESCKDLEFQVVTADELPKVPELATALSS